MAGHQPQPYFSPSYKIAAVITYGNAIYQLLPFICFIIDFFDQLFTGILTLINCSVNSLSFIFQRVFDPAGNILFLCQNRDIASAFVHLLSISLNNKGFMDLLNI